MARFHELITGFHSFRNEYLLRDKEFFEQLAHGQSPKTLVIACCDSRTDPAIILGCKPGDLFVVRSIAAIVPDKDSAGEHDAVIAAIEYGIKHLQVHDIVVMGRRYSRIAQSGKNSLGRIHLALGVAGASCRSAH